MKQLFYLSEFPLAGQDKEEVGLAVYEVDEAAGKLRLLQHYPVGRTLNASCLDSSRSLLHVTGEEPDAALFRTRGDRIDSYRLDPVSGRIEAPAGSVHTLVPNPVYLAVDPTGQYLLSANHTLHTAVHRLTRDAAGHVVSEPVFDDSSVVLYEIREDGTPGFALDAVLHEGSGPLRTQTHAHPHCAVFSPSGRLLAVPDKGADKVFLYRIENGRLVSAGDPYAAWPGDEPRFCAFHPSLPVLYVNHEGNTALTVLAYSEDGSLRSLQRVEAGPAPEDRTPGRVYEHQGIAVSPDGRTVYSVIRGVDAVAVYAADPESGLLELKQLADLGGDWPRTCALSPDGRWLTAGNRVTGELFLFAVQADGTLALSDKVMHPAGVHFLLAGEV